MSKKNKLSRAEASRRNGALSQGPTTPGGKERSSANAVKHGLTARYFFASPEEQADFDTFLEGACDHWSPHNTYQRELVTDLARVEYLHRRAHAIQVALLDHEIDAHAPEINRVFNHLDPVGLLALGYRSLEDSTRAFRSIDDHLARLSRDRIRLTTLLEKALGRRPEAAGQESPADPLFRGNEPRIGAAEPTTEPQPQTPGPQQEQPQCPA